jgi:hypothetical protein
MILEQVKLFLHMPPSFILFTPTNNIYDVIELYYINRLALECHYAKVSC